MKNAKQIQHVDDRPGTVSVDALIFTIGVFSGLLPFILYFSVKWFFTWNTQQPSMSDYAYTAAAPIFYGIVTTLGVVLIFYKGYPKNDGPIPLSDNQLATLAGIGAIILVIFPTNHCIGATGEIINWLRSKYATYIHFLGAGMAYIPMALFFIFYFTQSGGVPNEELARNKKIRNRIYRFCGWILIFGILFILLGNIYNQTQNAKLCDFSGRLSYVFWIETIMQLAVAIAWCTKYAGRRLKMPTSQAQAEPIAGE